VVNGNGCIIFDPHGDTIDDIISRIPNRLKNVILIDPSDYDYSFKINLLSAKSEAEKWFYPLIWSILLKGILLRGVTK